MAARQNEPPPANRAPGPAKDSYRAAVIGVSAGGLEALAVILAQLPASFPIPVLVVQHLQPDSDTFLAEYLDGCSPLGVKMADEKEALRPGWVYLAPPSYHLLVEEDETLSLSVEERVNYARPSIDVLFESAADAYGPALIGIILTGSSRDGSQGLKRIKERGGLTVVQDPATARAEVMPKEALAATRVDHVLALEEIGPVLVKITGGNNA